ncbi:MAG: 6-carboxyhexanoate--CoA ligase [Nitrospirota bacterium]
MKNIWSIRIRASKTVRGLKSKAQRPNTEFAEIHISGAEGLYEKQDIERIVKRYIERALEHPKGKTDKIVITIENIKKRPKVIESLPVSTVSCKTPAEGKSIIKRLLQSTGVSKRSIETAFDIIRKGNMRGASIITAEKGHRLDPDKDRGVRVSRLGATKTALKRLAIGLSRYEINTTTVKEALFLASKVASSTEVIAELCVSDDPDYTTGYVATKKFGYVRIPNIKRGGSRIGGRAFFVEEETRFKEIQDYLEKKPVIIDKVASCAGTFSIDEILGHYYK